MPNLFSWQAKGSHPEHQMHSNSMKAIRAEQVRLAGRKLEIYQAFVRQGSMTDRECMIYLRFSDMNSVRPRITELMDGGYLSDYGDRTCPATNRQVRVVGVKR